jgi:hypothetical protein
MRWITIRSDLGRSRTISCLSLEVIERRLWQAHGEPIDTIKCGVQLREIREREGRKSGARKGRGGQHADFCNDAVVAKQPLDVRDRK